MKKAILIIIIAITSSCGTIKNPQNINQANRKIDNLEYSIHVLNRHNSRLSGEDREFFDHYERQQDFDVAMWRIDSLKKVKAEKIAIHKELTSK